ncbi:MAG: energy transducer TonB [Pyrinomonadaceae bacterium]
MISEKLKVKDRESGFGFHFSLFTFHFSLACFFAFIFFLPLAAQKVAVLTPDKADASQAFAEKLESKLAEKLKVIDSSMAESAYRSVSPKTPFNLTTDESKEIGMVIGCDMFVILRSDTQRRSAFQRAEYYESYAPIYVVSSRTGRLVLWKLQRFDSTTPGKSEKLLDDSVGQLAAEIAEQVKAAFKRELAEPDRPPLEGVPENNSPPAINYRSPVPYRRIKPEYTTEAALYDTTATIEVEVDLDAAGVITRTEIARWAGFGLDESVEKTVRQMNWRPAERNGKPLPMRFLVRYNFKKIDKE